MADITDFLSQWIWNEKMWLPVGYSWKSLESNPEIYYPKLKDMIIQSFGLGIIVLGVRYVFESYFLFPVGQRLGVKHRKPNRPEKNELLENTYKKTKQIDPKTEQELCKKTGLDSRQIQRWFRRRRNQDVQGPMKKFCECGWLSTYYFGMVIYALIILWDKPWFWKSKLCYEGYPIQTVPNEVYWYYLVEMSFYWSLLITLLSDIKRKDFWQMGIHHVLTLSLMTFSLATNYTRIGSLVLFLHDIADSWIGIAKMAKYCNRQTACEILFGWFILIWIITRCFIYPYWILYNVVFESDNMEFAGNVNSKVFFAILLCGLQVLHWMWTYMILGIAIQKLLHGELKQDTRSESDGELEASDENENDKGIKSEIMENGSHGDFSLPPFGKNTPTLSSQVPSDLRQRN